MAMTSANTMRSANTMSRRPIMPVNVTDPAFAAFHASNVMQSGGEQSMGGSNLGRKMKFTGGPFQGMTMPQANQASMAAWNAMTPEQRAKFGAPAGTTNPPAGTTPAATGTNPPSTTTTTPPAGTPPKPAFVGPPSSAKRGEVVIRDENGPVTLAPKTKSIRDEKGTVDLAASRAAANDPNLKGPAMRYTAPTASDPLMKQAQSLQAAATGLDKVRAMMPGSATRPKAMQAVMPAAPATSTQPSTPTASAARVMANVMPTTAPTPLQPRFPVPAVQPLSPTDSATVQTILNRNGPVRQQAAGMVQGMTPGHNPSATQIPSALQPFTTAPATYPAPYATGGANAAIRNKGDNTVLTNAANAGNLVLTQKNDQYGNEARRYGITKREPAIMRTLKALKPQVGPIRPRQPLSIANR